MKQTIGGYDYYTTKSQAASHRKKGEVTNHESGLGFYNYNVAEYARSPLKRLFGMGG